MVRRDDGAFRYLVDKTLARLYRSGEIGEVYRHWFDDWTVAPSRLLVTLFLLQSLPD